MLRNGLCLLDNKIPFRIVGREDTPISHPPKRSNDGLLSQAQLLLISFAPQPKEQKIENKQNRSGVKVKEVKVKELTHDQPYIYDISFRSKYMLGFTTHTQPATQKNQHRNQKQHRYRNVQRLQKSILEPILYQYYS